MTTGARGGLAPWVADDQAEDLATWALRTRSPAGRAALADRARHGDPAWTRALARVEAWGADTDGVERAVARLAALPEADHTEESAVLLAQGLVHLGREAEALAVLDRHAVTSGWAWGVRADAANPWRDGTTTPDAAAVGRWLAVVNQPFEAAGLEPIRLEPVDDESATPFASLRATPTTTVEDPERVTVVMSAYNPDNDIRMAVRSVLDQSWTNLQLIVVDDASPARSAAEALDGVDDARLEIVRAEVNGGTYQARNLALQHARGHWITFHDSDDFAHPRRVELQVEAVRGTKKRLASRSHAIRAYPDLSLTYVGYPPGRLNASSLLFRREVVDLVGGFDLVRKSGDMEYPLRLQAARPGSVLDMPARTPLAITQLRTGSLSRSDAVPGWTHWTRIAYRDAYSAWHERIAQGEDPRHAVPAARAEHGPRPFAVPSPAFLAAAEPPAAPDSVDVVVVSDLRRGRARADIADRVRTLASHGLSVAVAHLEGPYPPISRRSLLDPASMDVVNDGTAILTQHHEPLDVGVVLVEDPECLLLRQSDPTGWTVRSTRIIGHGEGQVVRSAVGAAAGLWRAPVEVIDPVVARASAPLPGPVPRRRPGTRRIILGHPLSGTAKGWDLSLPDVIAHLPDDASVEVRLVDDGETPRSVLGLDRLPPTWVPLGLTGPRPRWLLGVDAVVLTTISPELDAHAVGVAAAAAAAGALVIAPTRLGHLGDLVVATDEPAGATVQRLWSQPEAWAWAVERARSAARSTAARSIVELLGSVGAHGSLPHHRITPPDLDPHQGGDDEERPTP